MIVAMTMTTTNTDTDAFWNIVLGHQQLSEGERIQRIERGIDATLMGAISRSLQLTGQEASDMAHTGPATLARLERGGGRLNSGGSERIDRLLVAAQHAFEVFENRDTATKWLSSSNFSLGGESPAMHCCTELGGRQVRRLLNAIEWGAQA
jgi:putative toxin-antitoxin system antitoxin component (TIGR02293 family)